MKFLMIVPKCRENPTSFPPYAALYVSTWLSHIGYEVEILNLDIERISENDVIERIKSFSPLAIGISGSVSTTYKYIKSLANLIKRFFPEICLIVGGQIANVARTVLMNMQVDVVVIGEGEITIGKLLESIKDKGDLEKIHGLAFKKEGKVVFTPKTDLIKDLDTLPFPDYDMIDMSKYLRDPMKHFRMFLDNIRKLDARFFEPERLKTKVFTILTGRGCQAKCTFCCRSFIKGIRFNSDEYILDLMELLKDKYNVGYFVFGDESFITNKKRTLLFLEKLNKRKLDILIYVAGARVDSVDKELLDALKKAGCFMIEYGFESGSQRMLDMMEKRTVVAENYKVYKMTIDAGLYTVPSNVINMPGETNETISETIKFLKTLNILQPPQFFVNYAQAHPGTPLFDYAVMNGQIDDIDKYLTNLTDINAGDYINAFNKGVLINFSKQPIDEVMSWHERIFFETYKEYLKRNNKFYIVGYLKKYFLPRFKNLLIKLFKEGLSVSLKYYFSKSKNLLKVYLSIKPLNKSSDSKSLKNSYLNELSKVNDETIKKIKKSVYTDRKVNVNGCNQTIDSYTDNYDGYEIVRYPSLRKLCKQIDRTYSN